MLLEITGPQTILSKTKDGPAATTFAWSEPVFGRLSGLSETNARACIEVGTSSTDCDAPPTGYAAFPNADWSYDLAAKLWRSALPAHAYPTGTYVSFAYNADDQSKAAPLAFTLQAAVCAWDAGFVVGGTAPPTDLCNEVNAGTTTEAGGYTWTCGCE